MAGSRRYTPSLRTVTLVVVMLAAGCAPSSKVEGLRVATSSIAAPAVKGWVAKLTLPPYPMEISLDETGSTTALQELIEGTADVAIASRRMSANEHLAAGARGRKIEESLVAYGIYQVLVNPKNTVSSLTLDQVSDIFSRLIKDWSEVGGPSLPVTCVYRRTLQGHFDLFFEKEVSPRAEARFEQQVPKIVMAQDTASIVAAIQANAGAVGYLLATDPAPDLKVLAIGNPLSKTEEAPSIAAALSGRYPLLRPLYLYIDAQSPHRTQYFREFALGDEGQKITSAAGFAPAPVPARKHAESMPMSRIPVW